MVHRSIVCHLGALVGLFFLGCGGATTKTPEAPTEKDAREQDATKIEATEKAAPVEEKAEESASEKVPTKCAKEHPCQPPAKWVSNLCHDVYPALGLYLFQKSMPWERLYVTRNRVEAVNASGGATLEGFLEFDEEVLLLRVRKADLGGMQVSGAGESYDALRWNGSCVTLSGDEVTKNVPPSPKAALVNWRILDDSIQEAMKEDATLRDTARDWRKECKGAASGEVTKGCEKLGKTMSGLIVKYVRGGGKVPLPGKLP
jgi:hypothetical protein